MNYQFYFECNDDSSYLVLTPALASCRVVVLCDRIAVVRPDPAGALAG